MFRPVVYSGCWAVTWIRTAVVVFEAVADGQKGVWFRSNGVKKVVNRGEYIHLVGTWGYPPPRCGQRGDLVCSLVRRRPVRPKDVPAKKTKVVCVLGMGFGHLARALDLRLGPVWARGSAFRGRILTLPPNGRKTRGYTPK